MEASKKIEFDKKPRIEGNEIDYAIIRLMEIPLNHTFTISLGSQDYYRGTIVELHSNEYTGYGEGATIEQITGEIPLVLYNNCIHIISSLNGISLNSMEEADSFLDKIMYGNEASKDAVETAMYDLIANIDNLPLAKLLGGSPRPIKTSYTITIGDINDNLRQLEYYKSIGVKIIKMKVGSDIKLDIQRIKAVADNMDHGLSLYADANQGYKLADAVKIGNILYDVGAIFFEQPLNRNNLNALSMLRNKTGIPVMLDESISTPFDIIQAISSNSVDLVNIKLTKSGGIRNAFKELITAQSAGIDAMVGCMLESKVGISAALAVASSVSNVMITDLDGYTYLSKQPFNNGIEFNNGCNYPKKGAGLAVTPNF
jgi:L-alanine-DL-glutamate epimerase-like enolase superfamily enzyme